MGREARVIKERTNKLSGEEFWASAASLKEEVNITARMHKLGLIVPVQDVQKIELASGDNPWRKPQ